MREIHLLCVSGAPQTGCGGLQGRRGVREVYNHPQHLPTPFKENALGICDGPCELSVEMIFLCIRPTVRTLRVAQGSATGARAS